MVIYGDFFFLFLNNFWRPEEIFLWTSCDWTLVWTRLFPTLRIRFFFIRREKNEKARFIDKISTCKCVVNGWPAWFVWKLPAPESFVPPINHVTNFSRIAWSLIDKLTRPLNFRPNFLSFFYPHFYMRVPSPLLTSIRNIVHLNIPRKSGEIFIQFPRLNLNLTRDPITLC